MPTDPLTHVILVNWNGKRDTLECLGSLTKVTADNMQVVVVDNGSNDGSQEEIRRQFPGVILLETGTNLRFAAGSNVGLRYALAHGAEQIVILNNDTTVDPGFLVALTTRLRSADDIGVVAPKILYYDDPRRIWYAGGKISMWTGTMRHIGIRDTDDGQCDEAVDTDYASGCCFLTKRETVERVGLMDESYYMYTEDADWCMRAWQAGYRIMFEPRARVWHKLSVSAGGHLSLFKMKNKFLGNLRFFVRYASWHHWLVFPWMNIVANGVAAARYLFSRR